ncbi:class I SAM-dependent methyltransferase [Amycolatopsis sp. WAC 04169]|uniref:daptide-type RiPP biosynthesis methyltransferase n=1 Tax=Amycolatopsis sp. WAC 04169 TaxID=2203197 RepID=UPI000F7B2DAC|nr:daptide-type RiPP biosynthesis methyltransferase [Amycolatopsis sp. WAC 04169]RSN30121.1 class I SAM-dependent methyltransferase [Amycolatopsis sp. WAC 04169]
MSDQLTRGPLRTAYADVLLASAGERGVLCDFYDEVAGEIYRDLVQDGDGVLEARAIAAHVRPGSGPVLELAAGMGRLTFPFLDLGWEVTALELSTAVIAAFRDRLAEAPSDVRDRCTIVQGDMSAFSLGKRFGTVVISAGSVNVLASSSRPGLYASVRDHLEPGGKLLFGVPKPPPARPGPESLERKQEFTGRSGRRYVLHARDIPAEETQEITIHPADETADPFLVCTHRIWHTAVERVVEELKLAGFDVNAQSTFASTEAGGGGDDMVLVEAIPREVTADAK